ncbi:MAG: helix-turn-helix domain-containing protein [Defluviitaleaceae bacterium]|nr:helix-turn-helix domain-containing protein [Defluviitaleaceae bacterium]MCL2273961.1 helix-turn-helix domain-containing protein [Defluviitaleaceae bacterium]
MKNPHETPYFWLSAKEYAKQTGIGVTEVQRMCRNNELIATQTDGGHWRIKVNRYTNGVPLEEMQKVLKRNSELEAQIETIRKLIA